MKKFFGFLAILITHTAFLIPNCFAAELQFRWETEVSDALPYNANAFQGETFTLDVGLRQYGQDLTGDAAATFYYQTKEMATDQWYSAPAQWDATTGRASVEFTPAMDNGATAYRFFFGIETTQGKNYRAYGTLRMKPSPGFNPAQLEAPDVYGALVADILEDVFAQTDTRYATTTETSALRSQLSALDEALETKAPLENPAFTGTPTVGVTYSYTETYNDQGAGMKGYYGRLANIGVQGNVSVTPLTMSLFRRNGSTTNGDASLYLRILRVVDGAWQVAYQSTAGVRMNDYAEHARMTWTLQAMNGHGAIPSEEMIAIVLTSSVTASATTTTTFGSKATSVSGGLITGNIATTTTPSVNTWRPAFCVDYVVGSALATMDDLAALPEPVTSWEGITGKPATFTPEAHTHTTSQITDFEDEVLSAVAEGSATLKEWVNAQSPDADGNINKSNLNSRADTVSDMTYINEGGTASRAISAITPEGSTRAQIQQVLDTTDAAHLSANVMVEGATATVKARTLNGSTIHQAMLSASASEAKLTLSDTTGTFTLTPTTQWPWSKLSGVPSTFTPSDHNHDSQYLKATNNRVSSEVYFDGGFRADSFKTIYGTPLITTVSSQGFAITGLYTLSAYRKDVPFYKYDINKPNEEYIDVKILKENGTPLSNKYAAKSDVSTLQSGLATVTSTANTNMADIFTLQTEAATHAPLSAVTMTESNVTYIWQWDADAETFALVPQE